MVREKRSIKNDSEISGVSCRKDGSSVTEMGGHSGSTPRWRYQQLSFWSCSVYEIFQRTKGCNGSVRSRTHRPGTVGGAFGWPRLQEGWTVCGAGEPLATLLGRNLDTMLTSIRKGGWVSSLGARWGREEDNLAGGQVF